MEKKTKVIPMLFYGGRAGDGREQALYLSCFFLIIGIFLQAQELWVDVLVYNLCMGAVWMYNYA